LDDGVIDEDDVVEGHMRVRGSGFGFREERKVQNTDMPISVFF
jgi:hypothetical protein